MVSKIIYPEVTFTPEWKEGKLSGKREVIKSIDILQDLCFIREGQLSDKIKGHDFNNGYSCALHDIRNELEALKKGLKLGDAVYTEGVKNE